jgi:phospho-N-acetylmuramoyl-pentapeptide-transferase
VKAILLAAGVGMLFTLLLTPAAIRLFRALGWGQRINEEGPHTHLEKTGTPTMGGVVMVLGLIAGYLAAQTILTTFTASGLALILATVGFAAVGFIDDFIKVTRRRSLGLSKTGKIVGQALIAIGFALLVAHYGDSSGTSTELSFIRETGLKLGIFFYVLAFIMLVASSNSVNITDGLDGLASGASILVLAAFVFIAFWQFRHTCADLQGAKACYDVNGAAMLDTAIVAAGMMGAATGFLWWNAAPARIFMGDTGALALGGLFGALAITTNTQLLLVVLGGLFVLETSSVIAQIISFRIFHRRVLKMSPIHHHFELSGWPEFTVIVRFWIIAGIGVGVGLGLYYADFIARGGSG